MKFSNTDNKNRILRNIMQSLVMKSVKKLQKIEKNQKFQNEKNIWKKTMEKYLYSNSEPILIFIH